MKRRSGKWSKSNASQGSGAEAEDSNSLTSEDENVENGDDSSLDLEPKEKRRRKSKGKKDSSQDKKPKRKSNKGRKAEESEPEEEENGNGDVSEDDNEENTKKTSAKKKIETNRKSKEKVVETEDSGDKEDEEESDEDETEFEVESIIAEKKERGKLYYLIRWKGFAEDSDTWEPAATLNCSEAIKEFKKKNKSSGDKSKKASLKAKKTPIPVEQWDENEDFEVVRILDVHFNKNGTREFLVAWKGYSHHYDSWEPEENMDCKDMIEKFLKKCEDAKEASPKELRVHRKTTDRFTLSTTETGRRLSRRNQGKQRIHYHDAE